MVRRIVASFVIFDEVKLSLRAVCLQVARGVSGIAAR
jgi:hypothetical protein